MDAKEGELKKRITEKLSKLLNPDGTQKGPFTLTDMQEVEDLKMFLSWVSEAEQEFPQKKERAKVGGDDEEYNEEYYDVDEVDTFKKKWFGQEVKV